MCWSYWDKATAHRRREMTDSEALTATTAPLDMENLQYESQQGSGYYLPATRLAVQGMKQPSVELNLVAGPTSGTKEMPLPHHRVSISDELVKDERHQPVSGVSETGDANIKLPMLRPTQQLRYIMPEWEMQQRRDHTIDQALVARIGYSRSNTHRTEQLCGIAPGAPRRATFGGLGHNL